MPKPFGLIVIEICSLRNGLELKFWQCRKPVHWHVSQTHYWQGTAFDDYKQIYILEANFAMDPMERQEILKIVVLLAAQGAAMCTPYAFWTPPRFPKDPKTFGHGFQSECA